MSELPHLYFDVPFPELYHDLIKGRAVVADTLADADAVVAGAATAWNAAALAEAPPVKVVSRLGVGYDNVDIDDLATVGVAACNAPLAPMVSTAEHAMSLLLAVTKHLPHHIARARRGEKGEAVGRGFELDGRTLGLVGCGRIACRVAAAARGFGMTVIAFDPYLADAPVDDVELVDFDELLDRSDVISLHAPATPATHHLIDAGALARAKHGVYLINAARGPLVDHGALVAALDDGRVAGAGLDATEPEPLPADHPLFARDNVVITPHIASATVAGRRRLYEHAIQHALEYLAGRPANVLTVSD